MDKKIKDLRIKLGMNQEQFAEIFNVTQGTVSQWETGLNKPRIDLLPKIARLLGCTVDELLKE